MADLRRRASYSARVRGPPPKTSATGPNVAERVFAVFLVVSFTPTYLSRAHRKPRTTRARPIPRFVRKRKKTRADTMFSFYQREGVIIGIKNSNLFFPFNVVSRNKTTIYIGFEGGGIRIREPASPPREYTTVTERRVTRVALQCTGDCAQDRIKLGAKGTFAPGRQI